MVLLLRVRVRHSLFQLLTLPLIVVVVVGSAPRRPLFQTITNNKTIFCPFFPSQHGRLPIKSLFQQRIQRATQEAVDTNKLLVELSVKLCQQIIVRQIQQVQSMATDEVVLLRETSQTYLDLLDQVDREARILTRAIPTIIGKPFAVLQKPIQDLNNKKKPASRQRKNVSKLLATLEQQLVQVLATQKLVPCNDSIEALKQVYPKFSSVLQTTSTLCQTMDHHVDVIPLLLLLNNKQKKKKSNPMNGCCCYGGGGAIETTTTTNLHDLELNIRHEQMLWQKAVQPIDEACAYLKNILNYRSTIRQLTSQLNQAIEMLLPIHQFAQDFFDCVGGPIEKGGNIWLQWYFGTGSPSIMSQYETDAAEWMVPDIIKKQLLYAANHLDPFANSIQPLETLLKEHLSNMTAIDNLNDSLHSLLQSDIIMDQLQASQRHITMALDQVLVRLQKVYTILRFCIMTMAAVIVPLDVTNLFVVVVGFLLPANKISSLRLIVVPTILKLFLDTLSFFMISSSGNQQERFVSFWTVLPYGLLLSDIIQDMDDTILLMHVAAILLGIFGSLHQRVLLRGLVGLIPGLIPPLKQQHPTDEVDRANNSKETKRRIV